MTSRPLDVTGGFGPVQTVPARAGITRQVFDVFRERFGIEATAPEAVTVLRKEINPVVDVEWLAPLGDSAVNTDIDLSGTADVYLAVFTVPQVEKWLLKWVTRDSTTASSRVVAEINGNVIQLTDPATARLNTAMEILLEPGDSIGMFTTGNGGDASREMWIAYTRYLVR